MLRNQKGSGDFVRLPCHAVATGDHFYFAWKQARRREAGIQLLRRWRVREAATSGFLL